MFLAVNDQANKYDEILTEVHLVKLSMIKQMLTYIIACCTCLWLPLFSRGLNKTTKSSKTITLLFTYSTA